MASKRLTLVIRNPTVKIRCRLCGETADKVVQGRWSDQWALKHLKAAHPEHWPEWNHLYNFFDFERQEPVTKLMIDPK